MLVKFMIHRGKASFLREKVLYRTIAEYYAKEYDTRFVDKGLRFSIKSKNHLIDFDFGYYRMRKRRFTKYDLIVSTGLFAAFHPNIHPGDVIFPTNSRSMQITKTQVIVSDDLVSCQNPMERIWNEFLRFEKKKEMKEKEKIVKMITQTIPYLKQTRKSVGDLRVHKKSQMVTANTLFIPSQLTNHQWFLKEKGKMTLIKNPQAYLEKEFDGLNC
jgi:hypothetical protein